MEKGLECQKCRTELGIERSISIKSQHMLEVTSGTIDPTPPSNGCSTSCTEVLASFLSKDTWSIMDARSGSEWLSSLALFTSLDHALDRENMTTMRTTISTSQTEEEE